MGSRNLCTKCHKIVGMCHKKEASKASGML